MTKTITTTIEAAGREYEVTGRLYFGTTPSNGPDPSEVSICCVADAETGELVNDLEFVDAVAAEWDEGHEDAHERVISDLADAARQRGMRVPGGAL
jgi:hypothetical protein